MELKIDEDVRRVLEFMQTSMSADRLVAVAAGVHAIAPIVWGGHRPITIAAMRLIPPPISADDLHTQSTATESAPVIQNADDDSAGETACFAQPPPLAHTPRTDKSPRTGARLLVSG